MAEILQSTSKLALYTINTAQTYSERGGISSGQPFTWTTNDAISISGQYEEA
jgi:hypothetical protein